MMPTREGPRPLRFAILATMVGSDPFPRIGRAFIYCAERKWAYLHDRGRVGRSRRLLQTARLFTTADQAWAIAASMASQRLFGVDVITEVIGWIAYCADDGVDHSDCRTHPGLSRACIESRRTPSQLRLVTA